MKPSVLPWAALIVSVILAVGFALLVRLPLPFDGFATATAAVLAFGLTLVLGMLAPAHWIWTDAERLRHAFGLRHGLSDLRSGNVLSAITTAHGRADALRRAAANFQPPLDARTRAVADRMDAVARELFYDPDALSVHRESLIRTELIEEAVITHASLRLRGQSDINATQIAESRAKVDTALAALEEAFDRNENRLADQLLHKVDISSATAEMLLRRRSV